LNFEFFLAKRIHFSKEEEDNKRVTPPVVRIAMAGVAIGLAVMIVAVAIVVGFKKEVRNKVIGFDAHIRLTNFDNNVSFETVPIAISDSLYDVLRNTDGIRHIERYATKLCVIKTETDFQGIVMKGIDADFDTTFFNNHLTEGEMIHIDSVKQTNRILISRTIANMLNIKVDDSINTFFVNNDVDVRGRKFVIAGVYDTGFADYDKLFILGDIKYIRRINGWDPDMASGIALFIDDYNRLDEITEKLYFSLIDYKDRLGKIGYIRSVKELNLAIFSWLAVLDSNVIIILTLMIIVSGFTMTSGLLIIILERINMIGVLKALGESNGSLRKVFLYVSLFLILKGMFWGNMIGLTVCFLQSHFHWLKMDPETYYLDSVPVDIGWPTVLLINIGTLIASILMMIGPSYFITKIEPVKSIKFD
jgi:lipoprotein-releasing system permease protein